MGDVVIEPLADAPFGRRVTGLDPAALDDATAELLRDASAEGHGLLLFDFGRLLTPEEHGALTRVFGEPELAPGRITGYGRGRREGEAERSIEAQVADLEAQGIDPFSIHLGNVDAKNGQPAHRDPIFFGEWHWHADMTFLAEPPIYSLLQAHQIPSEGGDTGYCSQVMAAEQLPADLRARIEGRMIKHDATYTSAGAVRPNMTVPSSPIEAPGQPHPILRTVPGTAHEALFLGRRPLAYVVDLALDESEALLDELWAHATQPEFSYTHRWTVGDLLCWDNRMLMHRRTPYDSSEVRNMRRTQTKGEAVVAAT